MKKITLILAAATMFTAANATILRVSNVTGSTAPYSEISDAMEAALPGDTIMVEGSPTSYGNISITKRIVLMGPGYNMVTNGIVEEGFNPASIYIVDIDYKDVQMMGITVINNTNVNQPNVVITRCNTNNIILNGSDATGCVIHKNYINGSIRHGYWTGTPNVSITNNIMVNSGRIENLRSNSYIAYNTFISEVSSTRFEDITGCTVENNILPYGYVADGTNTSNNNYVFSETPYYDTSSEVAIRTYEMAFSDGTYGAFAGDDPYVISGIPAGPVIEDITVPASVEQGKALNVTIKLGVQQ